MTKVKGIYRGNTIELLDPVRAKDGIEVDVIFPELGNIKIDQSFEMAMKRELERMEKGFYLGGGPYYQLRDKLHER